MINLINKLIINYFKLFFWIKTKTWNIFSRKVYTYSKYQQFFWKLYISIIYIYFFLVRLSLYIFKSDIAKIYGYGFLYRCLNTFNRFLKASEYIKNIKDLLSANQSLHNFLNKNFLNEISLYDSSRKFKVFKRSYKETRSEKIFRSLSRNKSILIIGSAPIELNREIKIKIEKYDYILVFNPRNLTRIEKIIPKTKKIAFYRGEYSKTINKKDLINSQFCIFKVLKIKKLFENDTQSRMIIRPLNVDRLGQTNGIQDIIFDLLNWEFSNIEVIGCDLLLTRGNIKGYRKESEGTIFYPSTFYSHPPELQFSFLKKIINSFPNKIIFDKKLNSIINEGLDKYLLKMENLSRNSYLKKNNES